MIRAIARRVLRYLDARNSLTDESAGYNGPSVDPPWVPRSVGGSGHAGALVPDEPKGMHRNGRNDGPA